MIFVRLLYGFALVASICWFYAEPGFEPGIAALSALSAVLVDLINSRSKSIKQRAQDQRVGAGGIGIQGGGDVNVGNVSVSKGEKDV